MTDGDLLGFIFFCGGVGWGEWGVGGGDSYEELIKGHGSIDCYFAGEIGFDLVFFETTGCFFLE